MKLIHTLAALAAALVFAQSALAEEHPNAIHVHDAFALTSMKTGAVFFMIHNHTDKDVVITGVASDAAELAELHTHKDAGGGVMQMMKIEGGVALAAGEMHEFARGGDHVMLMGLKSDLAEGDVITITLTFDGAEPLTFDTLVSADAMKGGHDHSQMGQSEEGQGQDHAAMGHAHGHGAVAAVDTTGMTDDQAIAAIMKAQFETPENPLTVEPVAIQGDHAVASWAQDGKGGRALLERRHGVWTIVLCGGEDLRLPSFLTENGVTDADALSAMFNTAEDALGEEKVKLYSSFEGVVMISPKE